MVVFVSVVVLVVMCSCVGVVGGVKDAGGSSVVIVESAERVIDVSSHVVKHMTTFKVRAKEDATADVETMTLLFDAVPASGLAYLKATQLNKTTNKLEKMKFALERDAADDDEGGDAVGAKATLVFRSALKPGASAEVRVTSAFMDMVSPKGAMRQIEEPILVYRGDNHYILSPYDIETQKTTVKTTEVRNFSPLEPQQNSGATLVFGPYEKVAAESRSPLVLSFVQRSGAPYIDKLVRTVEVSHWGGIVDVRDEVSVTNVAPEVKGEWSRLEYSGSIHRSLEKRSKNLPLDKLTLNDVALQIFQLVLPAAAKPRFFRDVNGKISTTETKRAKGYTNYSVVSRYPLMGGWKAEFEYGYSLPLSSVATFTPSASSASVKEYRLSAPFGVDFARDNHAVKDFELRVVLPEGATDITVRPPYQVEKEMASTASYLDTVGRPTLIVRKSNVVTEHNKPMDVRYSLATSSLLMEPLLLIAVFFMLFCLVILMQRVELRFVKALDTSTSATTSTTAVAAEMTHPPTATATTTTTK